MSEDRVAWTATPYRCPVLDTAGGTIGRTESLLGDEAEDIFHGIAVKRHHDGKIVEIDASAVSFTTATHVQTTVTPEQVASLPPYREERWYHLGWGGLFRKHPEWRDEGHQ
jgi:hypothetical protein